MKTITAVELRNDLEGVVKSLKRGERLGLSYRGEKIAEMVPSAAGRKLSPLEALRRAQEIAAGDPHYARKAGRYLRELREDQVQWGERSP